MNLYIQPSIDPYIHTSIRTFIHPSLYLSIHLSLYPSGGADDDDLLWQLRRGFRADVKSVDSAQKPSYDTNRLRKVQDPQGVSVEDDVHQRRLVLFAEPQMGKTDAMLGLIEVLRLKLQEQPLEIEELEEEDDEDGSDEDDDSAILDGPDPDYSNLLKLRLMHPHGVPPAAGKYGDPKSWALWDHYVNNPPLPPPAPKVAIVSTPKSNTRYTCQACHSLAPLAALIPGYRNRR